MLDGLLSPRKAPQSGRFLFAPDRVFGGLGAGALLLSWLLANHYPPWTSFHGEAAAFVAICCLAAWNGLRPGRSPDRLPGPAKLILLLMALVAVQWRFGLIPYGGDAVLSSVFLFGCALAIWIGGTVGDDLDEWLSRLAVIVVAAACVSVLIGTMQWHRLESSIGIFAAERGPDHRVFGNLAQPNHLGTLCLMATAFATWLHHRRWLRTWHFVCILTWLAVGIVLTESRSSLAGAMVIGALLIWRRANVRAGGTIVTGWWSLLVAGHLGLRHLNEWLYLAPVRIHQLGDDNQRLLMWKQSLAAIGNSLWWGHGWRQTMPAMKAAALDVPGRLATDYAHNLVLDLMIWVGVPLGLALAGGALWWLAQAVRRASSARSVLMLCALAPVIVHSLFEFPFAYAYFLFPAAFLVGALDEPAKHARRAVPTRPVVLALVAAYSVLCFAIAREYLLAEEDYRVMRFELRKVGRVPPGHDLPDLRLLTQLKAVLEMGRIQPTAGMSSELLDRLGVASSTNGWATLDLTYAASLALNGRPAAAADQLRMIRSVYGPESGEQALAMYRGFLQAHPGLSLGLAQ